MAAGVFGIHQGLLTATRFGGIHQGLLTATRFGVADRSARTISAGEFLTLLGAGAGAAAATGFVRAGLGIPGSSIVFAVLPMALGLALVPRRLAGMVMAGGAFSTAATLSMTGIGHYGTGAMTSLCLTGPLMDVALATARTSGRVYVALVLAGMMANLAALVQRGASKLLGFDGAGTRPFATWWPQASLTYVACGCAAGLIAALLWFRVHRHSPPLHGKPPG